MIVNNLDKSKHNILLRSSWQVVNIGDIAHTPGVLALLEAKYLEADVVLWASDDITQEVIEMEHKRFPNLKIVTGTIDENGIASNKALEEAIKWCDFLLHGSGPSLVGGPDIDAFISATGKPFGIFGITYDGNRENRELLSKAEFIFFRDSVSLKTAIMAEINSPIMEFGPDGAFSTDLRDDKKAIEFLKSHALEEGNFVCCIPRLRFTPYWKITSRPFNKEHHFINEAMKEHDHIHLREAIIKIARETSMKVLVCPEDKTQMQVGKELIIDKLPRDVLPKVVLRKDYWLTDEAISVYIRSAGFFGNEMHSPIMCIGNGIPAIVCRWKEQTSKGFMWQDIGLGEWLFDLDNVKELSHFIPTVMRIVQDKEYTQKLVMKAMDYIETRQNRMVNVLKEAVEKNMMKKN
jgi:hypothetical protein